MWPQVEVWRGSIERTGGSGQEQEARGVPVQVRRGARGCREVEGGGERVEGGTGAGGKSGQRLSG